MISKATVVYFGLSPPASLQPSFELPGKRKLLITSKLNFMAIRKEQMSLDSRHDWLNLIQQNFMYQSQEW